MPNYLKHEVVLVRYPFSDLTGAKVRPAVVVSVSHSSEDLLIVPLTSKTGGALAGEFVLAEWKQAGLNIETAVKRGIYTVKEASVCKRVGRLEEGEAKQLEQSLYGWLGLPYVPWPSSYEELRHHLRQFINAGGEPAPYDFNGVVHLMLALLDNLGENASESDLEGFREALSDEQAAFFLKMADYVR